jgi:hypothetical protein
MWQELTSALKGTFDVVREGADWLGIIRDGIPLRVERGDVYGESWVLVLVDVCGSTKMDYEEALQRNVELAVGSYALEGERIVLRAAQPLAAGAAPATVMITRLIDEARHRRSAIHDPTPEAEVLAALFPD